MKRPEFIVYTQLQNLSPGLDAHEAILMAKGYNLALTGLQNIEPFNPVTDEKVTPEEIYNRSHDWTKDLK